MKVKASAAEKKAKLDYIKKNVVQERLNFNKITESEMHEWLCNHPKKQTTIKKALKIMKSREETIMKKQYDVTYSGGESAYFPGRAVDYMQATVDVLDDEGNEEKAELYAERPAQDDEDANYEDLKEEILNQAKRLNIPFDVLKFWED